MKNLDILIVDDESAQREMLRDFLVDEGYCVSAAEDGVTALAVIRERPFDLVFVDYKMPRMTGLEVLQQAKQINPDLDIVIVTAYGTIDTAVEAMKAGAVDYLTKPVDLEEILLIIDRIARRRTLCRENEILRQQLQDRQITQEQIVYRSPEMAEIINLAGRVAPSRAAVLIRGESGTGKELLARLIHTLSDRSGNAMVAVNCAALPEALIESELFGHEKGAFTGASQKRIGRFEQADGGTLFLDEIGELSPTIQVKLLRFLQEGEYQRVGGNRSLKADVRAISATNQNLESCIQDKTFREDLFFRLNVIMMTIPALRERRRDVPPLVEHFIERFARANRRRIDGISHEAMDLLMKYDYPGNVRELENIIERAVVISRGTLITVEDLPFRSKGGTAAGAAEGAETTLREALDRLECNMIQKALQVRDGNQTRAAEMLGISERMLRYKIKKHQLK